MGSHAVRETSIRLELRREYDLINGCGEFSFYEGVSGALSRVRWIQLAMIRVYAYLLIIASLAKYLISFQFYNLTRTAISF
jgi:hypothetical protein